jgi:hypothetical protein
VKAERAWRQGYNNRFILCTYMQISMSVSATLMAVLTTASIPLGPMYVVVEVDIGWHPIGALVRVRNGEQFNNPYIF